MSAATKYDAIVVGLGAMGSAATYQLAKRGARVLGIDRFAPPHPFGSTHGDTRVTRLAIGEGARYTPFALRSHALWRELERQSGTELLTTNGGLIVASGSGAMPGHGENFFATTREAAETHGIAHEMLDAAQIRRRFPQFRVRDDEAAYWERDAGFVRPEACVRVQLQLAQKHGAALHTGETVASYEARGDGVAVTTDRARYVCDQLILAAGAWLPGLLPQRYARLFRVFRQVLLWFRLEGSIDPFLPERFPIFIWMMPSHGKSFYGFPALDGPSGGIKIATEQFETTTTADAVERTVDPAEAVAVHASCIAPHFDGIGTGLVKSATCLYTSTPDGQFVIDRHPEAERVIVVSPCSGHGFKHSAAIGEALAELVLDGKSRLDLGAFGFARFV